MASKIPNLSDPIVPGRSAAGIVIGNKIGELLEQARPLQTEDHGGLLVHGFAAIKVWSENGVITQIGLYPGYKGLIAQKIGIGSTIREIEDYFGCKVVEDQSDNLTVTCSRGWCFETDEWVSDYTVVSNREAHVCAIFVCREPPQT